MNLFKTHLTICNIYLKTILFKVLCKIKKKYIIYIFCVIVHSINYYFI